MRNTRAFRKVRYTMHKQTALDPIDNLRTFVASFFGIGLIGYIQTYLVDSHDNLMLIGSFGASAVLIYGAGDSPLAQPRNLIGGHLLSAFIGVLIAQIIPEDDRLWLAGALAVSLSIVAMQMTKSMHPPGGATALIANIGGPKIKAMGFAYVVSPVLTGVLILFLVSFLFNSLYRGRD